MKVSKVNNVRIGVSKKTYTNKEGEKKKGKSGILYDFPCASDKNNTRNIGKYVDNLHKNNQRLYHLAKKKEDSIKNDIVNALLFFERYFFSRMQKSDFNGCEKNINLIYKFKTKPLEKNTKIIENKCKELIESSIWQSFRKEIMIGDDQINVSDVICDFLIIICTVEQDEYQARLESVIGENKLGLMVEHIIDEYNKYKGSFHILNELSKKTKNDIWYNLYKFEDVIIDSNGSIDNFYKNIENDNIKNEFKYIGNENVNNMVSDYCCNIIKSSLKKSLRKLFMVKDNTGSIYFPDIIMQCLIIICTVQPDMYKQELTKVLGDEQLQIMLKEIARDYGKQKELERIKTSIEHQNVKVQVDGDGKLKIAGATTGKKEVLHDYLCEFVSGNKEKQDNMIKQFRQLVLFYLYDEIFDVRNVWDYGAFVSASNDEVYSIQANDINKKINKATNKNIIRDLSVKYTAAMWDSYYSYYNNACNNSKKESLMDEKSDYVTYWLGYISDYVKNHVVKKSYKQEDKVNKKTYIAENVMKHYISFLCGKYIDMGKAVYHFAMDDLDAIGKKECVSFGTVSDQYHNGLTSFDYERIKAVDSFERNVTTYITFAVNNFSNAVKKEHNVDKDILSIHEKIDFDKFCYTELVKKRILAYFGGESTWSNNVQVKTVDDFVLFSKINNSLNNIRNSTFHYTADVNAKIPDEDIINDLFAGENNRLEGEYKKKYYSNNVFLYYEEEKVRNMVNKIYAKKAVIPAQIPSFSKVLSRPMFRDFCEQHYVNGSVLATGKITDYEQYRSSLYFIFKELYYHDFLTKNDLLERFNNAFEEIEIKENESGNKNRINAVADLKRRLDLLNKQKYSFSQICQDIMTVYNQQNNQIQKKLSSKDREDKAIYQHYPMLLYRAIREAFFKYLKDNFKFLTSPKQSSVKPIDEIVWSVSNINLYSGVEESIKKDYWLKSWYVVAHFLHPKQLNLLMGTIKKYIQFMENIEKREITTGNQNKQSFEKNKYNSVIEILEFVMNFSGNISSTITDYYKDEEDYAEELANYVNFVDENNAISLYEQLKNFDSEKGIYCDNKNPIINRNIVMSNLYGNAGIISRCYNAINENDFTEYKEKESALSEVFKKGICNKKDDQENLKKYTELKNHIELVDILTYSELLNDFMSHLISWCILRERDLMYFQLGIYYMKLFHTTTVLKDSFLRKLKKNDNIIIEDGAVLYQIVSMYTYELPIYERDKKGNAKEKKNVSTGRKVVSFVQEYCGCGDESQNAVNEKTYYNYGLQLFEDVIEHDELIRFRNYIDHFKYYTINDYSMMDLYSEMFDRFLKYDLKLRKSVPVVIKNILMNYFLIGTLNISLDENVVQTSNKGKAKISIKSLYSDMFTYKNRGGFDVYNEKLDKYEKRKSISIPARNEDFINCVVKMLDLKQSQNDEK